MPNLTTALPKRTGDIEKDYDNLYDWAVSLVDELKAILCNLDAGNVTEANSVKAQNIDVSQAKIKDAQIKSLTADKLTAGTIDTGEITIKNERGNYEMNIQGDSIVFYEDGVVRIAIGRNEDGKYIFTVQSKDEKQGIYMNEDGKAYFSGTINGEKLVIDTDIELGEVFNPEIRFIKTSGAIGATLRYDDSERALIISAENIKLDGAIIN